MPKKGHTEEQIVAALQRVESGRKGRRGLSVLRNERGDVLRVEESSMPGWE